MFTAPMGGGHLFPSLTEAITERLDGVFAAAKQSALPARDADVRALR